MHRGLITQRGLLADLAAKRLPYLLSFQHPINEQGSLAFLRELYTRLLDTQTVPAAVRAARGKLSREVVSYADANAFGSPTLYTTLPQPGHCTTAWFRGRTLQSNSAAPGAPGHPRRPKPSEKKLNVICRKYAAGSKKPITRPLCCNLKKSPK